MAATHRYPLIPPSVLARAHKQHQDGLSWLDAAKANGIGYTAMMSALRKAGYDMTTKHKTGYARRAELAAQTAGLNSTAVKLLSAPLRGN